MKIIKSRCVTTQVNKKKYKGSKSIKLSKKKTTLLKNKR